MNTPVLIAKRNVGTSQQAHESRVKSNLAFVEDNCRPAWSVRWCGVHNAHGLSQPGEQLVLTMRSTG
ncbi:hypothetical protein [Micromonospora sp. KLBMP9576]|uniref:hypothetical protein n=1 Tax=Micromonospora sp. KLBMP9576 TaxID=3424769 RepID=UPI003D93E9A8